MARYIWTATWLMLGVVASAQTLTPTNWTNATTTLQNSLTSWELTMDYFNENADLLPLQDVPLAGSLQGDLLLVDTMNLNNASFTSNVALISCDPQPGFTSSASILTDAINDSPRAIVLYSTTSAYCNVTGLDSTYSYIYSMVHANDSQYLIQLVNQNAGGDPSKLLTFIHPILSRETGPGTNGTISGSNLNPAPTTAIAMIILYTITGVITLLFLAIIITGAVRAHRHPERYGLRAGAGRPRRSRAHGLARAMLDSLPIVKFGDREEDRPKPTEIELENARHGQVEMITNAETAGESTGDGNSAARDSAPTESSPTDAQPPQPSDSTPAVAPPSGIAPAAAIPHTGEAQGCSICTDDFELGQDQRVLPCDHRFHPACIDPWLLNVSGTCPLCRIDLHPPRSSDEADFSDDGINAADAAATHDMAPPLGAHANDATASHRLSIRRSIVIGLMGFGRPETMSREERVLGLRQLRGQQAARRRREEMAAVATTPDEERRLRRRLRDVFSSRHRRGAEAAGSAAAVNQAPEPVPATVANSATETSGEREGGAAPTTTAVSAAA